MKRFILLVMSILLAIGLFFCTKEKGETPAVETKTAVQVKTVEPFYYVALEHVGPYEDHETVIQEFWKSMQEQNIQPAGSMFGIYYNNPQEVPAEELKWEIGVPVSDSLEVKSPLKAGKWEFTKVASYLYIGPFEQTGKAYGEIMQFIQEKNMQVTGPSMERFLSDPKQVPPESLKTEIWMPVQ